MVTDSLPLVLRVQGQNVPALIFAADKPDFGQQFGFEFGIRNVDTSGAVNRLFASHLSERVGSFSNITLPNPYHASGQWDTRNGKTPFDAAAAVGVNDTTIRRDGGWSSSSGQFRWNRTGGWHDSLDETQFQAASLNGVNYLSTRFALDPSLPFYRDQLFSGNTQDLIRLAYRDGSDIANGGAIYISGNIEEIPVPVGDFLWFHEIDTFNLQAALEGEGTRFVDTITGSAWDQVNRYAGGSWYARDTGFGKQVYYRDGIF